MAQVNNTNIQVNPRAGGVDQEKAQAQKPREKAPVNQAPQPQQDRVDLKGKNRATTVEAAIQKVNVEHEQKIARETPAIKVPEQNSGNINLGAKPPQDIQPKRENVDRNSIQSIVEEGKTRAERPPTVIQQKLENAAHPDRAQNRENENTQDRVPRDTRETQNTRNGTTQNTRNRTTQNARNGEARQTEANQHTQTRQEQKQNVNETEQRRNPAAVQTQRGQNVNKLV